MSKARVSNVARVASWLFAGITYSIHVGRSGTIQGWMLVSAMGPGGTYRSVALDAPAVDQVLSGVLTTADPGARADTIETLIGLQSILLPLTYTHIGG